jgi:hypothetical protein
MWWLVIIVFGLLIPEILSTVLDSRLGRAVAAQIENRGKTVTDPEPLVERIRYLEGELDRLSGDVQKLRDESEFFQKLLTERASEGRTPPSGGNPSA